MCKLLTCTLVMLLSVIGILTAQDRGMVPAKSGSLPESPYRTSWALLIGINKYPDLPTQYQLSYAVNDVNDMKKVLIEQYQFTVDNIITLTDKQATKQKINDAMGQLTDSNKVKSDDRVLVYFSGHGQTVPLQNSGEMGYLLPYDAKVDINDASNPSSYYTTCLGMDELRRLSQIIPAKHVLFLVDACYSGLAINSSRSGLQPSVSNYLKKISSLKSRQIITAGLKGEVSIEKPEWGHGAFTYKLLEALRTGVADENSDGATTGLELASYLRNVVPNISPNQTPQYGYFEGEGEFLFIKTNNEPEEAVTEDITTMATILVDSEPSDASVYMDDKEIGKTPYIVNIDTGIQGNSEVTLAITKEGYEAKKAKIKVNAGKPIKWAVKLSKIEPIPVTNTNESQEQSSEYKKTTIGWLGAVLLDIGSPADYGLRESKGSLITDILTDGPAYKAGFRNYDCIIEFDGKQVLNAAELTNMIRACPNKQMKVKFIRDKRIKELDLKLAETVEAIGKDGAIMVLFQTKDKTSLYIDERPVTDGQYKKFLKETGHIKPEVWYDEWNENRLKYIVQGVSYDDAQAYCK